MKYSTACDVILGRASDTLKTDGQNQPTVKNSHIDSTLTTGLRYFFIYHLKYKGVDSHKVGSVGYLEQWMKLRDHIVHKCQWVEEEGRWTNG